MLLGREAVSHTARPYGSGADRSARAECSSGSVVAGTSPLGQRARLRTVGAGTAELFNTLLVSAGRRRLSVEPAPRELVRLTGATVAGVAGTAW